jgi:hypothetical protein
MAVQIGLPPNITKLINKMNAGSGAMILSDGQISMQLELHSAGLGLFLKSIIRVLASTEAHNEMAFF